tara:strand:+ start:2014 stop:2478 length:465 start_codon:yes stop_codon:yes gene_type:complete
MQKLLMVCLGNICRSPLAQGILESKIAKSNLKDIIVDSAGTGNWHSGSAPDQRSIEIAKENGIDISKQKARQFNTEDFNLFDKIFVMDTSNYATLLRLSSSERDSEKIKLILDYSFQNKRSSVPDPYYGGSDGFKIVFQLLDQACEEIMKELKK